MALYPRESAISTTTIRERWNKGKLVGEKAPLKLKEIWAIRVRLQLANRRRELALFNLAIDSKLGACDLVKLRVRMFATAGAWHPGRESTALQTRWTNSGASGALAIARAGRRN